MGIVIGLIIGGILTVIGLFKIIYFICSSTVNTQSKEPKIISAQPNNSLIKDVYSEIQSNIKNKLEIEDQIKKNEQNKAYAASLAIIKQHYKTIAECIVKDAVTMSMFGYQLHYILDGNNWINNKLDSNNEFNNYLQSLPELAAVFNSDKLYCIEPGSACRKIRSEKYHKIFDILNEYLSLYNLNFVPGCPNCHEDNCRLWSIVES